MDTKRTERKRVAIEKQIDENLRRVYEQDETQELPERLLALLAELRKQD